MTIFEMALTVGDKAKDEVDIDDLLALIYSIRVTVTVVLILTIAYGWGVTKMTLGVAKYQIAAFGTIYFLTILWHNYAELMDIEPDYISLAAYSVINVIFFLIVMR